MERVAVKAAEVVCGPRQTSLLALGRPGLPADCGDVERTPLGRGAWIDHAPGWLPGADAWFDLLTSELAWSQATRPMYDRVVAVPRLIANLDRNHDRLPGDLEPLSQLFDKHYGRRFGSIGANWYRHGDDSVAIHRDKVVRPADSIIAIVSLGQRRPFLLRPDDGGPTRRFTLGDGDLFVMGGTTQQHWEHGVPKVRTAGGRVSVMFRG